MEDKMFSGPDRSGSRLARRSLRPGLALVITGAFLLTAPALAGAEEGGEKAPSNIRITQEVAANQPLCLPGTLGLTNNVKSTAESFKLTVKAFNPRCSPVVATAAIYAMPGKGTAWPQRLVETKDFTIDAAGTTTIEFMKTCAAQQFDVVVGPTPEVIDITGPWHGPPLFPFDTGTAQQYWGCAEGTTTVPPTTTPATTIPPTTLPTVTTVPPTTLPTVTTVPPEVLGTSTVPPEIGSKNEVKAEVLASNAKAKELAFTGSSSRTATLVGVLFLVLGSGLILVSRKRNAAV
ncbi:MAG TPA: hypothetical protein VL068_00600 [Microthrixaceae bacterium]|nr:hypothetical protein [Microthrixaceae bacterium]